MGWEPLVDRPCHSVRKEEVTLESTTKVNDQLATVPMILTAVSYGSKRVQASSSQMLGLGEGYWFHRLKQGPGCPALGAVHFPGPL
jgi:hypothetical protein